VKDCRELPLPIVAQKLRLPFWHVVGLARSGALRARLLCGRWYCPVAEVHRFKRALRNTQDWAA